MGTKDLVMGRLLGNAQKFSREQVAQTVTMLLEHAHGHRATDIHIEPRERYILVRYRVDGVLRGVHKLPLPAGRPLIKFLKELAQLSTTEVNLPQEGRYDTTIHDQDYTVLVATLPVLGGEKIVLHLRHRTARLLPLESLGFWGNNLAVVRTALTAPQGLIIVAGGRRSGKTTTLYSLLHVLTTPLVSIATIEDPIEHRLHGVAQTQVHPRQGVGFAEGLQAAVGQDANIIMLSNLPDSQTIELALHASSDGHLVLAGMPAARVTQAVVQLLSTGLQPFLLASSLRLVVAQELVRQLCPHCKQRYELDNEQNELLVRAFHLKTAAVRRRVHELEQQAAREGLGNPKQLNSTPSRLTHLWQPSLEGCADCDHMGYIQQLGLTEVLAPKDTLRSLLQHIPTPAEIQEAIAGQGFVPLPIDGLVKALRGLTTIEEVLRVISTSY